MDQVRQTFRTLYEMDRRQAAHQFLNLGLIVCSAIMIWKGLVVISGSESPVVVVLSGSMEPAFFRGDILFLWMGQEPFRVGEIIVFKVKGRDIPIVHRVLEIHEKQSGEIEILTKGDNNPVDDRGLYNTNQLWLKKDEILGRAKGFLPYIGMVTIYLTDYPALKYLLVGLMGLFVITTKEQQ